MTVNRYLKIQKFKFWKNSKWSITVHTHDIWSSWCARLIGSDLTVKNAFQNFMYSLLDRKLESYDRIWPLTYIPHLIWALGAIWLNDMKHIHKLVRSSQYLEWLHIRAASNIFYTVRQTIEYECTVNSMFEHHNFRGIPNQFHVNGFLN